MSSKETSKSPAEATRKRIIAEYPLSEMQQGLLFHSIQDARSGIYINQVIIALNETIIAAYLEQAINQVIARHEVLRGSLDISEDKLKVHQGITIELQLHDLSDFNKRQQQQSFNKFLLVDKKIDFDYTDAPLLRFNLFKFSAQEYRLVLSYHHALFGGPSAILLVKEVFAIYDALHEKNEIYLPQPISYQKYIDYLTKVDVNRAQTYWQNILIGFTESSQLLIPNLEKRGSVKHKQKLFKFPHVLLRNLKRLARQQGLTVNILLQAAWGLLLAKYSGKNDVVFGVIRELPRALIKDLAGLFINTVPLRVQIHANTTLIEYLEQIRKQYSCLQEVVHLPLQKIQQLSELESGVALFDTVVDYKPQAPIIELQKNDQRWLKRDLQFLVDSHYPLLIEFFGMGESLHGRINYTTDRFDTPLIKRLHQQLMTILNGMVSAATDKVLQIPTIPKAEQSLLLEQWNATRADYPNHITLAQLFEKQVNNTPQQVAVTFSDAQLTYAELNQKANQLAHYLIKQNIKPDSLVAIYLDRSLEMILAILGVLKAGAAYVPLDPAYPQARIEMMLQDCQAPIVLTQENLLKRFKENQQDSEFNTQFICLDTNWKIIAEENNANPITAVTAHNLAYVIYTSGSTGKPKGVLIEHASVVNFLHAISKYLDIGPKTISLALTSFAFDISGLELYLPLISGGQCIIVDRQTASNGLELSRLIQHKKVNLLQATPTTWDMLIGAGWPGLKNIQVLCGGEALNKKLAQQLLERVPYFWHLYGPTETTIWSTVCKIEKIQKFGRYITIGKPIANTQIYILDKNLQVQPIGIAGELYIGGLGLARGYLNQPILTQEKFIANPFVADSNARLYKTGDLARWLSDGTVEYIGRLDDQIKIRGYRVELNEVEVCLLLHPDVAQAAVIAKTKTENIEYLVAYVVAHTKTVTIAIDKLQNFLKQHLPDYMLPTVITQLDSLPLTPNGKINKKALPEVALGYIQEYIPPRYPEEEVLIEVWAELLKLKTTDISIQSNFFTLGGHSISAMQLMVKIQQLFNIDISLRMIFDFPTIEGLSKKIHELVANNHSTTALTAMPRPKKLPLSFAQQRLWFLSQLQPTNPFYNIFIALGINGDLNIEVLQVALEDLVARHEILRTCIKVREAEPYQQIMESIPLASYFWCIDTSSDSDEVVFAKIYQAAQTPFNLYEAPLFRVNLLIRNSKEFKLLICMHHCISDGWSLDILSRELSILYAAKLKQESNPLLPLTIQYADYAIWQRQYLENISVKKQLHYWQNHLQDLPVLSLPTDYPRPVIASFKGKRINCHFAPDILQQLKNLAHQANTTLFTVLLSLYDVLLARYTNQEDIVVGTPIAGRHYQGVVDLVGCFVNTLILRSDLTDNPTFLNLLTRNKEITLQAYANQDIPFEKLVEVLQPKRDQSYSPLCQVMLVLQNPGHQALALEELNLVRELSEHEGVLLADFESAKFDLSFYFQETEQGLQGIIEYSTDLFAEQTIKKMLRHFEILVDRILQNPETPVLSIPMLTQQESKELLVDWNNTYSNYPRDKTIHQLFEEQVANTPNNIALEYAGSKITYQELNNRANQLALMLADKGADVNSIVVICLKRTIELFVAILGVLKTGASYLPLDENCPIDRFKFILDDSKADFVISTDQLIDKLTNLSIKTISMERLPVINDADFFSHYAKVKSSDIAYIIYTSGSTGKPKGVMINHQNVINYCSWFNNKIGVKETDVFDFSSNIACDISVTCTLVPLVKGAKIVICNEDEKLDPLLYLKHLKKCAITIIKCTPSFFTQLREFISKELCLYGPVRIILGGEAVNKKDVEYWLNFNPEHTLINEYGPTETTVAVSAFDVNHVNIKNLPSNIPIGRPSNNNRFFVLNKYLQLSPVNVIGELFVSGDSVSQGYLNNSDLTNVKFIPNPFAKYESDILYKTGDLVRWLPNGNIQYIGRADEQVKIYGYRVEISEIESVLLNHPKVKQAAVILKIKNSKDNRLIAYISTFDNCKLDKIELYHYLKIKLPSYMLPANIIQLDDLPLLSNDKINKKALLTYKISSCEFKTSRVYPANNLQKKLAKIWSKLLHLNLKKISINDSFFDLGGHSLLAIKFKAEVKKHFDINLDLSTLFNNSTIMQISEIIEKELKEKNSMAGLTYITNTNSPLIILQQKGNNPTIFLFHPVGGTVFCYMALALYLGESYPCYAFQDPGIQAGKELFIKLEDMASFYIEYLLKNQPDGPYLLAGASFGGTLAVEIAYQLKKMGKQVSFIGLLDTWAIFTDEFQNRKRLELNMLRQYQMTKLRLNSEKIPHPERWLDLNWHRMQLWFDYTPPYIDQKLTLFKASELLPEYLPIEEPANHWGKYTSDQVDIHIVPGNHETMLIEPNVQVLAEKFKNCLDKSVAHIKTPSLAYSQMGTDLIISEMIGR